MWTPSQVTTNFDLIFETISHPACRHHHAGRGLQGTRQWGQRGHITSVAICAPRARLSPCRGSESLAPRVEPSQQPPPAQHTVQIQQPSTVMFTITPSHPLLTRGPWQYNHPCLCNISLPCSICCSCHPLNTGPHLHLWSKFIKESPLRPIIGILWSIPWLPGAGAPLPLRPSYEVVSSAGGCRGRFVFDFWTLLFS